MGKRIVSVKAKSPFLASSQFFNMKDIGGRQGRPYSVKASKIKGLFDVGLKF